MNGKGDARMRFELALSYLNEGDNAQAELWLEKAFAATVSTDFTFFQKRFSEIATSKDSAAQFTKKLVSLLAKELRGDNAIMAVNMLRQLADSGNVSALYEVGYAYYRGYGVEENDEKAFKLFCKAAEASLPKAVDIVADCYRCGIGIEEDEKKATEWETKAFLLYLDAANNGDVEAQYEMARHYEYGCGCEKDQTKTFEWLRKAAENGHPEAMYDVSECYRKGAGIGTDCEKALEWYVKSAVCGDDERLLVILAQEYCKGGKVQGVELEKDYNKAIKYAKLGIDRFDSARSFLCLGKCYYYGRGVEEDEGEAAKLFQKAAEKGEAEAQDLLGDCYKIGRGVDKDLSKAKEWYRKAAAQGNEDSKRSLEELENEDSSGGW